MTKAETLAAEAVHYGANIEAKRLTINAFTVIMMLGAVVSVTLFFANERSEIYEDIKNNRNHIDTKIVQVLSAVEGLKVAIESTQKRTKDRFTRKDAEVQCLKIALFNPGIACPNPSALPPAYYVAETNNWQRSTHTKKAGRLN